MNCSAIFGELEVCTTRFGRLDGTRGYNCLNETLMHTHAGLWLGCQRSVPRTQQSWFSAQSPQVSHGARLLPVALQ
jgi:hypothetical protein